MEVYQYSKIEERVVEGGPVRHLIACGEKRLNFAIAAYKDIDVYITGGTLNSAITYTAVCLSLATCTFTEIKLMD